MLGALSLKIKIHICTHLGGNYIDVEYSHPPGHPNEYNLACICGGGNARCRILKKRKEEKAEQSSLCQLNVCMENELSVTSPRRRRESCVGCKCMFVCECFCL